MDATADNDFDCVRVCTYVEEADELAAIVGCVRDSHGAQAAAVYQRFHQILSRYQEQPQLLDPHLSAIVEPLAGVLREGAVAEPPEDIAVIVAVSRLLWAAATIRGAKVVTKFFPNQAADLEPVLALLHHLDAPDGAPTGAEASGWEAQCVALAWLEQLVLLPFDLALLDSSLGTAAPAPGVGECAPLARGLVQRCQALLSAPGSARDAAARLLGRLLARPDMAAALDAFAAWAADALGASGPEAVFLVPGVACALAAVCEATPRGQACTLAPLLWPSVSRLLDGGGPSHGVLARKLGVKLAQRLGLAFLPPREAAWRYRRGTAALGHTLGTEALPVPAPAADAGGEADDADVAPEVEEALGLLLDALRDRDTVVRWQAAKGVGRITARLPQALGDEVAASVLELLAPTAGDGAWHGACLALAELARRGLLSPARLPAAAPLIATALHYDARRGSHSVGAHVRDAAAYVCWSLARAYEPRDMAPAFAVLAPALLATACYDREVMCRRAAAAAFQESVGRAGGGAPHGIEIVTAADFFSLATRQQAFLTVGPAVGAFGEFRAPLAEYLAARQLRHWEAALRALAARALGELVAAEPPLFAGRVLGGLLLLCLDPVLEVRHGAVLGVAELVAALASAGHALSAERLEAVAALVPAIERGRLFLGKGGELMRAAAARLVECIALALAATTLAFAAALADVSAAARRGAAAALGALPARLLRPAAETALGALAAAVLGNSSAGEPDAEARAAAVRALTAVAAELCPAAELLLERVVPVLLVAMGDYATDARGDVGSWVREAAMAGLEDALVRAAALAPAGAAEAVDRASAAGAAQLAKQAVERIARLREAAVGRLRALLRAGMRLPARHALEAAVLPTLPASASNPALGSLARLVREKPYTEAMLEGLAAAVGGLDGALGSAAAAALGDALADADDGALEDVGAALLAVWRRSARSPRLATPLLRLADTLFAHAGLGRLQPPASAFPGELLGVVAAETRGCRDVARLRAAASCLCHLVAGGGATQYGALQALLGLLASRLPRVRADTAEALYMQLLAMDEGELPGSNLPTAMDLLTATAWDGPAREAAAARDALSCSATAKQVHPPS
ncbi:hypothetical protein WJX81_008203 [Elliptochloris bilobata]|uniref:Tubulin-specific chaperone D n=1 Tax=Elliptochloris bilobata TaxID=381761 RepID=A0AAW1SK24_9CHLO